MRIKFEETTITDPQTNRDRDAVAVIRNGRQVALLPEADRLRRALNLSLEEIEYIIKHFPELMNRPPTQDEQEFWKAVLEYRRGQEEA
jgi:hypothetical protein